MLPEKSTATPYIYACPNGTVDTEIERLFLLIFRNSKLNASLSLAQISFKKSICKQVAPPSTGEQS